MPTKVIGCYIVANPDICHGKPTFRGTRVIVWQVLDMVATHMDWDQIGGEWRGKVAHKAIEEAVRLANQMFTEHIGGYKPHQATVTFRASL